MITPAEADKVLVQNAKPDLHKSPEINNGKEVPQFSLKHL